jgi:malonyl CoA-acyl carrier protein transacylase
MSAAFVFPGQGSQAVGMGKALADTFAAARAVFEEVDAALADKLSTVMWEGPAEKLTLTENAQPALVAVSLAAMRVLESEDGVDWRGTHNSSPAIRSGNILRWRPVRSRSPTRYGWCAFAGAPCRRRCRSGWAPWRR